jgi:hypothetical protein
MKMTLWRDGRTVRWIGVGSLAPRCNSLSIVRDLMEALLDSFADIFTTPCGLPPQRRHNHRICLLPGTAPVAVWPFLYPQLLKDEVERQCGEMLHQGIILKSTSAFSSPVLLVKKADNT